MLGHCYARGEGVPQSWVDAVQWYRVAADDRHAEASYHLAECYEKGLGVPVSREGAMKLYKGLIEDHRAADDEDWMTWVNKARAALLRMR
jgi:TPR repeat protein